MAHAPKIQEARRGLTGALQISLLCVRFTLGGLTAQGAKASPQIPWIIPMWHVGTGKNAKLSDG